MSGGLFNKTWFMRAGGAGGLVGLVLAAAVVYTPVRVWAEEVSKVAGKAAPSGAGTGTAVSPGGLGEDESSQQLRIFRESLLNGTNQQMRIDAAVELLCRGDRASLEVLVGVLVSGDNPPARQAVCRALIKSSIWNGIDDVKKDFLKPLLGILAAGQAEDARLAAEALAIFDYKQVEDYLARLLREERDRQARLNVVYALKLWSDKEAISELADLLDDPDTEVALAVRKALQEIFGLADSIATEQIRGLVGTVRTRKSAEAARNLMIVQRERMAVQKEQIRLAESERDRWQKMYLSVLNEGYESLGDDAAKGKLLVEKLGSELSAIKLWALEKLSHYSGGLPDGLRARMLLLVSDADRQVRLEAAKVLGKMSVLDPADKLLEQLKAENDPQVSPVMLEALGEACFFAFSPGSPIKLNPQVKEQTLSFAAQYVSDGDPDKVKKGAEVIRKLLELNGLEKDKVAEYLGLLAGRYERAVVSDPSLRPEILSVMARMCGTAGTSREQATGIFRRYFVEVLEEVDAAGNLREAAVTGLANIDRAEAFALFKEKKLTEDRSPAISRIITELAGQAGTTEDIGWLLAKTAANSDTESACSAITDILKRQNASVIVQWAGRISQFPHAAGRCKELFEIAEKKAEAEKDTKVLVAARMELFGWYKRKDQHEQVIAYGNKLLEQLKDENIRTETECVVLDGYLATSQYEKAGGIVAQRLALQKDLPPADPVAAVIERYLGNEHPAVADKTALVDMLGQIKHEQTDSPKWKEQLKNWGLRFPKNTADNDKGKKTE